MIYIGTGSGSLSHYFIRAVKPHGHLHTFDFHENRVRQAREEFAGHGIQNFVTVCLIEKYIPGMIIARLFPALSTRRLRNGF